MTMIEAEQKVSRYSYIPELYNVRFKKPETARQADEYFDAEIDGQTKVFNIHDYASLYRVPWLYDIALYHALSCRTPTEISDAIASVWAGADVDPAALRAFELGAGSGTFGYELRHSLNIGHLEGIDIHPEAQMAAMRDRPGLYDAYYIDDLTDLRSDTLAALKAARFNVVAVASATGWGNHIPVAGFQQSFDILMPDGWFIFHVKPNDPDPECIALCDWIDELMAQGHFEQFYRSAHYHRKSSNGSDITYDVVIGRKIAKLS